MFDTPLSCSTQSPVVASRCETGLDNSPLYDQAQFIDSADTIDSVDVGMTALVAMDSMLLANLSSQIGRHDFAAELTSRSNTLSAALNSKMWNEDSGLYLNRQWTSATQPGGGGGVGGKFSDVAAPTCFYPMLAGAANDTQVLRMVSRWLTNSTEFAVSSDPAPRTEPNRAMPSVSRSSSAFHDNSYWRGRAWGPMNWLVYLGLKNYNHLPEVKAVMAAMASQSEATFLVEWVQNHRVMENYNSVTGVGCDVGNAIPFYHWGALMALVPLVETGAV